MKVFISGPVSGTSDYKERFATAEKAIEEAGDTPINPVKLTEHLPDDTPWTVYMEISLAALKNCDAIYMLTGWVCSTGANIENLWALGSGKEIIREK